MYTHTQTQTHTHTHTHIHRQRALSFTPQGADSLEKAAVTLLESLSVCCWMLHSPRLSFFLRAFLCRSLSLFRSFCLPPSSFQFNSEVLWAWHFDQKHVARAHIWYSDSCLSVSSGVWNPSIMIQKMYLLLFLLPIEVCEAVLPFFTLSHSFLFNPKSKKCERLCGCGGVIDR